MGEKSIVGRVDVFGSVGGYSETEWTDDTQIAERVCMVVDMVGWEGFAMIDTSEMQRVPRGCPGAAHAFSASLTQPLALNM